MVTPDSRRKRCGRGQGSGLGKTSEGDRRGRLTIWLEITRWIRRGQFRTFMKLPIRGFNNAEFRTEYQVVNLEEIEAIFTDGETVNIHTLIEKGFCLTHTCL